MLENRYTTITSWYPREDCPPQRGYVGFREHTYHNPKMHQYWNEQEPLIKKLDTPTLHKKERQVVLL